MNITSNQIKKYNKYSIPGLRKLAGDKFRAWIRKRDKEEPCISCGANNPYHAGHFYSAGHYPVIEFNPDNVHYQCVRCNTHLHGNLLEYRKRLIQKIGIERVEKLDFIVDQTNHNGFKLDRFLLIEIIETYK